MYQSRTNFNEVLFQKQDEVNSYQKKHVHRASVPTAEDKAATGFCKKKKKI